MPITIPIEIGDVIRTGKFKNKRITVKEIGLDEYQLPTVNGKGILKIRIEKLMPPKEPKQENNNMNKLTEGLSPNKLKEIDKRIEWTTEKNLPAGQGLAIQEVIKKYKINAIRWGYVGTGTYIGVETAKQKIFWKDKGHEMEFLGILNKDGSVAESFKPNKAKLDRMIREALHSNDTQVKIKQKDKLWWICQEETDECLNAVGFETKEQAEHSALTKGYSFSGQEEMNEMEPEILTTKKEKVKGVDKVEDIKLDKEKEIKLEILRIAKRVIKEELKKPNDEIQKVLDFIKSQIGLKLTPDSHFSGIKMHNGKKYFNVILNQRTSESGEFNLLDRFAKKGKLLKVEPNGVDRVSIFFDESLLENKKKSLNELEITDPSIVKKLEEMAKMSDEMDRLKNEMTKLKKLYEPLDEEITAMLEEVAKTGDRALETKTILVTIKKMGNPAVEVAAYKERFEQLYSKVNGAMKKQSDEYWESVRTFKKIPTSIGVQYKKTEGKLTEDNVISRLVNKVKSFFSNIYNKIVQYGKISENGISELHKLTGV